MAGFLFQVLHFLFALLPWLAVFASKARKLLELGFLVLDVLTHNRVEF
jgi:hypothetical protein